ncbi:MAG: sensor histidine kinase [Solirubrobacteraceae bacterium]
MAVLVYGGAALGLLAYALGLAVALLAASNSRQSIARADQAELLLAQIQRSQEERLRVARLQESTRIACEIHDVLAHALAGLTIQLEATRVLVEQGADREIVLERVARAHALAREGLQETRRAVGALRGDAVSAADAIAALVSEYRSAGEGDAQLTIDGDARRLSGPTGLAVLRTVPEALTNVRKHARGADVAVSVHAGAASGDELVVTVDDRLHGNGAVPPAAAVLAASGGGYGLEGHA